MKWKGSKRAALGAGLTLILAAAACSCEDPNSQGRSAELEVRLPQDGSKEADYVLDFGDVPVGSTSTRPVVIRNRGSVPLRVVFGPVESPFASVSSELDVEIGIGAESSIPFSFGPKVPTETSISTIVSLETNEPGGTRSHRLRLQGRALQPGLACDPAALDFGPVVREQTRTLSTTCTNLLPLPVEVNLKRKGNFRDFFQAGFAESAEERREVPAKGKVEIEVTFRADSLGENDAILALFDENDEDLGSVALRGETVSSALSIDPATCLDFGYLNVGETARKQLALRNIGTGSLALEAIEIPESASESFSSDASTPIGLEPGADALLLPLSFHPTRPGASEVNLGLRIRDGSGKSSTVSACVKGFGGGPSLSCTPAVLDFGMVAIGMPVTLAISCVNDGVAPEGVAVDPLRIEAIGSDDPQFQPTIQGGIDPKGYRIGEGFTVEVAFDPVREGFSAGEIQIESAGAVARTAVSGEGRDLPPCDFSNVPPALRFGIVDRHERRTLSFGIVNNQDTACLINDLRLSDDSDPAFQLTPLRSVELAGLSTLEIEVTLAPEAYQPRIQGTVQYQISHPNPAVRHQGISLSGTSARPCLLLEPLPTDFGAVGPGCDSRERIVSILNTCTAPLTLTRVEITDSLSAEEFAIVRRPKIPITLDAGSRAETTVVYRPKAPGAAIGAITVEVEGSEPYLAMLEGVAAADVLQTDTYSQREQPKVDILWVIDNSGSFAPFQERLSQNLPSFLSFAKSQGVDYQIAVTTTGINRGNPSCPGGAEGGEDGRFFPIDGSHPRILSPTTPDLEDHWRHNIMVGTCHGTEQPLEAARRALSEPLIREEKDSRHYGETPYLDGNAGFLRPDAALSIIFVTDEVDQSTTYGWRPLDYLAFFRERKGASNSNRFKANAIVGTWAANRMKEGCQSVEDGDRILELVEGSEGTWLNICTPANQQEAWAAGLEKMSEGAFGFEARFILRGQPGDANQDGRVNELDIEVSLDGRRRPSLSESNAVVWSYDPLSNAIDFSKLYVPKTGTQISVTYRVACVSSEGSRP